MKRAINFRLHPRTLYLLQNLAKSLSISKTEVVERALLRYAKQKLDSEHPLAKFAGSLNSQEAEKMLQVIRESKTIKDSPPPFEDE